jgi:hypothetical protein
MAVFRFPPLASVFTTAAADDAFDSDSPGADTLIVGAGSSLIATGAGASGANLFNTGAWTVIVNGFVVSDSFSGIGLASGNPSSSCISVGTNGQRRRLPALAHHADA